MIEVERKFLLEDKDEAPLIQGAKFLSDKTFTDTYYDTKDYRLTTQDWWLRERDGKWELKVAMRKRGGRGEQFVDQYDELDDEKEILQKLGLPPGDIRESLSKNGYESFCTITTTRRKYQRDDFVIDFDLVNYGYNIVEIEAQVENKEQIPAATEKILSFAKQYGLKTGYVRGKVIEYLRRKNLKHYQALVDSGVVV